jgi:hypothetical protein
MAQHRPGENIDDLLEIIKSQQGTINGLVALANEQIKIIGQLIAEPDKRAAVITGLEARLAAMTPK